MQRHGCLEMGWRHYFLNVGLGIRYRTVTLRHSLGASFGHLPLVNNKNKPASGTRLNSRGNVFHKIKGYRFSRSTLEFMQGIVCKFDLEISTTSGTVAAENKTHCQLTVNFARYAQHSP